MEYVYDILTEYVMENHVLRLIAMSPNIEIAVNRVWFAQPFGTPEIWFIGEHPINPHTLGDH